MLQSVKTLIAVLPCLLPSKVCPQLTAVLSPEEAAAGLNVSSELRASVDKDVPLLWQEHVA